MEAKSQLRRCDGNTLSVPRRPPITRGSDVLVAGLARSPLFGGVSEAALRDLAREFRRETWQACRPAMTAAQTLERLYVIVSGRLKVGRINPDTGREVGLMLLGPGDVFDVVSLLDGQPLPASTQAVDDLEVLSAPLRRVHAWRGANPDFDRALHAYLARQLRSLADLATELALYDTDARLARLILRESVPDASDTAPRVIDGLSHEALASLIGSVRAVVNRHIQELKRDGIISARRGHLAVEDPAALARRGGDPSAAPGASESRALQPGTQTSLVLE